MPKITLRLSFAKDVQLKRFMGLLRYLAWCGDVGHSTSVTVHADGDGDFMMGVDVLDELSGKYREIQELIPFDDKRRDQMVQQFRQYKKMLKPEHRDINELSFSLGD